jgi:D-alanyl-D-alanine carboxypeptidase/D-alanyl-D-alanine-endopeptidase (penicillin-binding protein 4)
MSNVRARAAFIALALLLCVASASAQDAPLEAAMKHLMANPRAANAVFATEIYNLDTGRMVYAHDGHTLVTGASTTKLVTEGATLTLLGPDFRWTTPVYRDGPVDAAGTLHGNLTLVASGDPNLSQRVQPGGTLVFENEDHAYDGSPDTKAVPGDPLAVLRDLAAQVKAAGIRRIDGNVIVDASLFPNSTEGGTGTTISPIVVNDNVVDVTVTPGAAAGDPVTIRVSPESAYVSFVVHATTGAAKSDATIDLSDDVANAEGRHTVTITGTQPLGPSVLYAYRIPDPKLFAEAAFARVLTEAGIAPAAPATTPSAAPTSSPATYSDANLVAKHVSPPLSEDVYVTLKVSQNLHASLMPYMWGAYGAHARADVLHAGFKAGADALQRAGVDLNGAITQDGAGGNAFFTPDFMVHYLAWAHRQPWFSQFRRGLPIMGVDGTLAKIQITSPARGKVFAKTGTDGSANLLRNAQVISKGLAGYMTTSHGRHVAFAFYVDHVEGPTNEDTGTVAGQLLGSLATATYEAL